MRKLGFRDVINWVFNPAAGVIAGALGEKMLIYYCVDEYTAFSGVPGARSLALERELLRKADLVIVSADRLLQSKRRENPGTVLVRHGVDYDHFSQGARARDHGARGDRAPAPADHRLLRPDGRRLGRHRADGARSPSASRTARWSCSAR